MQPFGILIRTNRRETTREENVRQSVRVPARNVPPKRVGPTRQTNSYETPLGRFSYLMPGSLLLFILENTIQNFYNRSAGNADYFYKNKHCKLLDMVELFFGLLYLRALLKLNLPLADVIWY